MNAAPPELPAPAESTQNKAAARLSHKPHSLRRRLLLWVAPATLLIYLLAATLSYHQARHEVQAMMDGQMTQTARLLLAQAKTERPHVTALDESVADIPGARRIKLAIEFTLWNAEGSLHSRSKNAPNASTTIGEHPQYDNPPSQLLGFSTISLQDQTWRTLTLQTPDGAYRVQVVQSTTQRDREALEIAMKTVQPLAILLPLLLVLIYFAVRYGLKPLDELAADVAVRNQDNLQKFVTAAAPIETQPLVHQLNRLLERLSVALNNERRFTADAAHELRTPLAALKIHAQLAMVSHDPAACKASVAKVIAGADRATRLVDQLLRLARLDPLQTIAEPQVINLTELIETACADAAESSLARGHLLSSALETDNSKQPIIIHGDHDLLAAALRNLVDNAIRYAPEASDIHINASREGDGIRLQVRDSGPGVPQENLSQLVERFYRGADVTAEGNGLGLAIVRRIAELHSATLEFTNIPGGGFVAGLHWPATQGAEAGISAPKTP